MAGRGLVVVVGLGPAGAEFLLPIARDAIVHATSRYARTTRHPAIADLAGDGVDFVTFDALYDAGDDLDSVYGAIADALCDAAAREGEVLYAVPGNPVVAERTVGLLRERDVDVQIVPGLSFSDLAWSRVGVDPMRGGRVLDAHEFSVSAAGAGGPLLIAQCDDQFVCSDVKLALLEVLAPDHPVTVLQRLGLADERVFTVPLTDIDRVVEPDHLTSFFVDTGDATIAGEFARFVALVQRLRGPGGCPWDAEQTHHSLRRHVLEEAYEVAAAIEDLPSAAPNGDVPIEAYDALADELGDLLFQVVIQSVLAAEAGAFTIADVARTVHDKLVRRHPHVFGDVSVSNSDDVVTNWEQIKKAEKNHTSLVEGITPGLPALIYAQKLYRKATSVGLDPYADPEAALRGAVDRLAGATGDDAEAALGEVLATATAAARGRGLDAESALAGWARRFVARFAGMEALAEEAGIDLATAAGPDVANFWALAGDRTHVR
ncbi:MAG: MazG family protein [Actinomycetia bacterium]|nr:MazG family protein [Actinomycetes bacterium]